VQIDKEQIHIYPHSFLPTSVEKEIQITNSKINNSNRKLPTPPNAQANPPVQVMAPPWYDAVDACPSVAHVNGLLEPLEKKPGLHESAHVSATAPVCLPCSLHFDVTTTEFSGKFVGLSHVSSSHALWPPLVLDPGTPTPK